MKHFFLLTLFLLITLCVEAEELKPVYMTDVYKNRLLSAIGAFGDGKDNKGGFYNQWFFSIRPIKWNLTMASPAAQAPWGNLLPPKENNRDKDTDKWCQSFDSWLPRKIGSLSRL